ncbi:Lactoylglutathione lyase and related lyases [Klebsiella pneumoniae IS53]|nr:Lactoylglutathione lyase and related lyases [Klebsiella pneumoniae IS53]
MRQAKNFYTAVLSALEIPVITTSNEYLLADDWWWPHATARRLPGN